MATILVPGLLIAGFVMTWLLVGNLNNLSTTYGMTLLGKVAVVGFLLALAAANKLRFVPAISAGDAQAALHLRRSITLESVAFLAILLATSLLTSAVTLPS